MSREFDAVIKMRMEELWICYELPFAGRSMVWRAWSVICVCFDMMREEEKVLLGDDQPAYYYVYPDSTIQSSRRTIEMHQEMSTTHQLLLFPARPSSQLLEDARIFRRHWAALLLTRHILSLGVGSSEADLSTPPGFVHHPLDPSLSEFILDSANVLTDSL